MTATPPDDPDDTTTRGADIVDVATLTARERAYLRASEAAAGRIDRARIRTRMQQEQRTLQRAMAPGTVVPERFVFEDGLRSTALVEK